MWIMEEELGVPRKKFLATGQRGRYSLPGAAHPGLTDLNFSFFTLHR